jgi:hypothetical protein
VTFATTPLVSSEIVQTRNIKEDIEIDKNYPIID